MSEEHWPEAVLLVPRRELAAFMRTIPIWAISFTIKSLRFLRNRAVARSAAARRNAIALKPGLSETVGRRVGN